MAEGIDYAWGRPRPSVIKTTGRTFVVRYLSRDTTGKTLTQPEVEALTGAGLWIACVFEDAARQPMGGRLTGREDARFAAAQAASLGMPPDRPIYFAVDWDVLVGEIPVVIAYLRGVADVIGIERTGVYGGLGIVQEAFAAEAATWAWQTYAWSGGGWDPRAQLRQYSNDHLLDGVSVDYCRSTVDDFGQWMIGRNPEMALTKEDLDKIATAVLNKDGLIKAPDGNPDNTHWALKSIVGDTALRVRELRSSPPPLSAADVERVAVRVAELTGTSATSPGFTDAQVRAIIEGVASAIDVERIVSGVLDGMSRRMES